uniref:Large ribosomal subunit protein uL5 n=1 Tax=Eiseniibacteriota bacterium TaxID=2212470 RepID=A0A832I4D8_UNCEI
MADDKKAKGGAKPAKAAKPEGGKKKGAAEGGAATGGPVTAERPHSLGVKPRLAKHYEEKVRPALVEKFKYTSVMQAPKFEKIVINMGVGDALQDQKLLDAAMNELGQITGQRPSKRVSKKSISNFKLRQGVPIGCAVTLRGARMYEFYDRLINVAVPRIRDFRGVSARAFDGRGNYTLGLTEQIIFPEINIEKVGKLRGMDVTIVTTAKTDEEGRELLRLMNMPFRTR